MRDAYDNDKEKPIISYFDGYGRGEPARMMFAHANVEFIDDRIQLREWPQLKQSKFGGMSLPVITVKAGAGEISGKQLNQSQAVFRFIAKECGYYPNDVEMQLDHDWIIENYVDIFDPTISALGLISQLDPKLAEEKQAKLFNELWPRFIESLIPYLKKSAGRFLFVDKLTEADFMVGRMYTDYMCRQDLPCHDKWRQLLDKYPDFEAYGKAFADELKPYLDKRPHGAF